MYVYVYFCTYMCMYICVCVYIWYPSTGGRTKDHTIQYITCHVVKEERNQQSRCSSSQTGWTLVTSRITNQRTGTSKLINIPR